MLIKISYVIILVCTYIKNIMDGKLSVIGSNAVLETIKTQPYVQYANNMITDLIELEQYLKASWFNEIGLKANYNMKREAINSAEANLGDESLLPLVDDMLHSREKWVDEVNKMFGTNIIVKLHSGWSDINEGVNDEVNADNKTIDENNVEGGEKNETDPQTGDDNQDDVTRGDQSDVTITIETKTSDNPNVEENNEKDSVEEDNKDKE